ncbi:MAG TPA: NUDIX hydrolase YfcD [Desulfobulbaceae bacterium]|nr:NUDIX hydrolase YfcD [Desulfobulbaceae bacterium]
MRDPDQEIVQIVDEDDNEIGAVARHIMRKQRLIHRASYILVFNTNQELFVQKRTMSKDMYPGYLDVAAGGVVLAGESYEQSAERELEEELGIRAKIRFLFDHYYEDDTNRVWGRIFSCIHEGPFTFQPEEVADGWFMTIDQALDLSTKEPFTPDGLEILQRLTREQQT